MISISMYRVFRWIGGPFGWHSAVYVVAATLLWGIPSIVSAQPRAEFEKPPVLQATQLVPQELLRGEGVRVEDEVPTDGVMGLFTLHADAETYHEHAGTYEVRGSELFTIRMGELPAIIALENTSKTGTFMKSLGANAVRPVTAAGNMLLHPIDTVTGMPSGVGRLFDRVGEGTKRLWGVATDSSKSGGERVSGVAATSGRITRDALGYEKERRGLAKKLGVDPYTTNPVLAQQLDQIAWVSFAGRLGVSATLAVAVPGSMILTGVRVTDNLIWDTPRGDLIVLVETRLKELEVSEESSRMFVHNRAIPLSVQVALVEHLARLQDVSGRAAVIDFAGSLVTESQARFMTHALRMLIDYHEKNTPIIALAALGPVVGQDRDGRLILPAPVDYVAWTGRVASFATSPALEMPQRTIWLAGKMSPRAREEFEELGWTVQ